MDLGTTAYNQMLLQEILYKHIVVKIQHLKCTTLTLSPEIRISSAGVVEPTFNKLPYGY